MNIVLFKDYTTEEALTALELDATNYEGLYVDMDDAEQRKYVKDKASAIKGMLKALEAARIKKAKDYKFEVEREAGEIRTRLENANKNFTLLIDDYTKKRAEILAEEKRIADLKTAQAEKEIDHDDAIICDKLWEFERTDRERAAADAIIERQRLDSEIAEKAAADAIANKEASDKAKAAANLADKNHCAKINNEILAVLLTLGLNEAQGKMLIGKVVNGLCGNMIINY